MGDRRRGEPWIMTEDYPDRSRTEKLHADVLKDISARQRWETRQDTWYKMRYDGLARRNKPWAHAADLHLPLADNAIADFLPFYYGLLFDSETVGQFVAKVPAVAPFAQEASYWFDFKLRQESNLETEALVLIDKMLMAGHGVMKTVWNAAKGRLKFDAIEPTHCIVPDGTQDLQDADRVTLVHHRTPAAYRRDKRFKRKDEDFIKRITGRGNAESGGSEVLRQTKEQREGITHAAANSDTIIIWEMWEQTEEGWFVHWISPLAPDEPLRPMQRNPYRHKKLPIVRFDVERTDKGHYSSRGIPELVADFEVYGCKVWNEKSDAMTLYNRPIFGSDSPIPNAGNLRLHPGQIVNGLRAIGTGNRPPISFDEEINAVRGLAEQRVGSPDYGIGQQNDKNDSRTAHEIERIAQEAGKGVTLRARIFRSPMGELLQLAWGTLVQYDRDTQYYVAGEAKKLPMEVLVSDAWKIQPNGSAEGWNKQAMVQKAVVRMQLFGPSQGFPQGMPWINQPELAKSVLELDDPRLVGRLFIDTNAKARDEYEQEGTSIPAVMMGLPLTPKMEDDQAIRIKAIVDFISAHDQRGIQLQPEAVTGLRNRVMGMLQMLQQKNPQQAAQVQQMLAMHAGPTAQPQPEQAAA